MVNRHCFWLDGECSTDHGILCSGLNTYNAPERDTESIEIPGRNGALTLDNGRWRNLEVVYPAIIVRNFQQTAQDARAWLCSKPGYRRLEDDYNPDTYRMARFVSGMSFDMHIKNDAGQVELVFDCAPQRWLKSGEEPVVFSAGGDLINPTLFNAQPKIVLSGNGTLTINGNTVTIADNTGEIILDSEICRAYSGTTAKDDKMTGDFPVFVPGGNAIAFTGFTSVEITPRWWTL